MGFNWEQVLGTTGECLSDVYDEHAANALCQGNPRSAPPGSLADFGGEKISLPFEEN
jgi:hypothetical protein